MSNSHLIQYIIIALIAVAAIGLIVGRLVKIRKCSDSKEDLCQCCSAKSLCGKKKKSEPIAKYEK